MSTLLVVGYEKPTVQLVKHHLASQGYLVETASSFQEALDKVEKLRPDLIVLDPMMPGRDGLEVCRRLGTESGTPIIILSAGGDSADKVMGLEAGADDYITKPFNPLELAARVTAVLRRYHPETKPRLLLEVGDVRVDVARRKVTVAGQLVEFRPREFDLLVAFAECPGVALGRDMILTRVWGQGHIDDPRTLDVHVTWLRKKLAGSRVRIETVRGVGYRLADRGGSPFQG